MLVSLLMTVAAVALCCYCLKRKSTDVLPPFKYEVDARFRRYRNGIPPIDDSEEEEVEESESSEDDTGIVVRRSSEPKEVDRKSVV